MTVMLVDAGLLGRTALRCCRYRLASPSQLVLGRTMSVVDVEWAKDKLNGYVTEFREADESQSWNPDYLMRLAPTVLKILKTIGEKFDDNGQYGHGNFWALKDAALRGLGRLDDYAEIDSRLRPDAPMLVADQLHPWIWEAARPSWESELFRAAVHHAASALNEQLQKKVNRTDISDSKLAAEAYSDKPPVADSPRLRIPGDPGSQTQLSKQAGARSLAQGAFLAIRNPAAHETHEWPRNESLESLAVLSAVARLIETSELVVAP